MTEEERDKLNQAFAASRPTFRIVTADTTLTGADLNSIVFADSDDDIVITLPQHSTEDVGFFACSVVRRGTGHVDFAVQGSDVLEALGTRIADTNVGVTVARIMAGFWGLYGNLIEGAGGGPTGPYIIDPEYSGIGPSQVFLNSPLTGPGASGTTLEEEIPTAGSLTLQSAFEALLGVEFSTVEEAVDAILSIPTIGEETGLFDGGEDTILWSVQSPYEEYPAGTVQFIPAEQVLWDWEAWPYGDATRVNVWGGVGEAQNYLAVFMIRHPE